VRSQLPGAARRQAGQCVVSSAQPRDLSGTSRNGQALGLGVRAHSLTAWRELGGFEQCPRDLLSTIKRARNLVGVDHGHNGRNNKRGQQEPRPLPPSRGTLRSKHQLPPAAAWSRRASHLRQANGSRSWPDHRSSHANTTTTPAKHGSPKWPSHKASSVAACDTASRLHPGKLLCEVGDVRQVHRGLKGKFNPSHRPTARSGSWSWPHTQLAIIYGSFTGHSRPSDG
jgi:hypothetical protein